MKRGHPRASNKKTSTYNDWMDLNRNEIGQSRLD